MRRPRWGEHLGRLAASVLFALSSATFHSHLVVRFGARIGGIGLVVAQLATAPERARRASSFTVVLFLQRACLSDANATTTARGRHLSGCVSSTATGPFASQIAALAGMAAMIDRPHPGIETGAAGAGRHRQGGGDGENERPLPYQSRPRRVFGLGIVPTACGNKFRDWR